MAIVLIVVALSVGGIVVGREMYATGKARSLMLQMDEYELAYSAFKLKYNCIPGDCAMAAAMNLGPSGNGDGYVGSVGTAWSGGNGCMTYSGWSCGTRVQANPGRIYWPQFEMQQVFTHLSGAGMVRQNFAAMTTANNPGKDAPGYTMTDDSVKLHPYFPKAATDKTFIIPVMWGGKLYLRTGVLGLFGNGPLYAGSNYPLSVEAALTAMQMKYIHDKKGYTIVSGASAEGYPNAAAQQRVFPTGMYTNSGPLSVFLNYGDNICTNAAGTQYRVDGYCDLLWQIN